MKIQKSIEDSIKLKNNILHNKSLLEIIEKVADEMVQSIQKGGKVFFYKNFHFFLLNLF